MYNCHSESKYPRKYDGLRIVQSGSLAARHGLCLGTTLSGGEPITAQWPMPQAELVRQNLLLL